jgi:UDP-N-acetyl-D-glucosamine dehydrogenase
MKIAVVGMGKIGLPLAAQFATRGHTVVGVDINPKTVSLINQASEPFPGEESLDVVLQATTASGHLRATTSYEDAIPGADAIVVVVPLFVDESDKPDFGWMDSATESMGSHLTKDTLVIYETTLPIGTTRGRWKPLLEKISGLEEGKDFHLIFSPERVLTGRVFQDLRKYPKLIGGLSVEGAIAAKGFYEAVLDFDERTDLKQPNGVWDLGSPEAAEMAKLAETTYRDVNIALANQFALHADELGVDVYKIIEACNSQPYSHIHRPGISVGGHCIPVYPRLYLSTDSRPGVVRAARDLNTEMPALMVSRLADVIGPLDGKTILILGISYRAGVKEDAFSGVYPLNSEIFLRGAIPLAIDPFYSPEEIVSVGLRPCVDFSAVDAIIVHTDHPEFQDYSESLFPRIAAVVDGRNLLSRQKWAKTSFVSLGKP